MTVVLAAYNTWRSTLLIGATQRLQYRSCYTVASPYHKPFETSDNDRRSAHLSPNVGLRSRLGKLASLHEDAMKSIEGSHASPELLSALQ
jgi:hypothetical protein